LKVNICHAIKVSIIREKNKKMNEKPKTIPPVPKFNLALSDIVDKHKFEQRRLKTLRETMSEVIAKLEP
jgi:hypothetical protein